METLGNGQFFGEECLVGGRYKHTFFAKRTCEMLRMSRSSLKRGAERFPELAMMLKIKTKLKDLRNNNSKKTQELVSSDNLVVSDDPLALLEKELASMKDQMKKVETLITKIKEKNKSTKPPTTTADIPVAQDHS